MVKHVLFASFSVAVLFQIGVFAFREQAPEWKKYEKVYYEKLAKVTNDPKVAGTPLKVKQIWNERLNRADRCTTCHGGIDNPAFENEPQPYKTHSNFAKEGYISKHAFEKFGCTICHEGDGQAVTVEKTHGVVHHLDRQLLTGPYVQAACTKCHYELYSPDVYWPETKVLMEGKRLATELGCVACHAIRQLGSTATLAPEISSMGSKTELAFYLVHDYSRIKAKDHTTRTWEWEHFKDPQKIVPGTMNAPNPKDRTPPTIMPNWNLTDDEATALTVFVLSLRDPKMERIPREYLPKVVEHNEYDQFKN
ncbi:MAG: c-type cytochrome [Nitrospirae bacterium]|nr:c-type cytochrome [Candidatus Manganitrophaceae bacterium]